MGVNFPNDEIFLTTEEVLEYLQVNLRTVYRLIKAGKIPAVRVGRQWRFRKRDIDAWLDSQRPAAATAAPSAARPTGRSAATAAPRMLVVDDESSIRELLPKTLALAEYDVDTAPDGRAALERLRLGHYDLLIADLKMPGIDGLTLIREAKRLKADLPVIIITGFSTESSAIEAVNLGVAGYLTKPFRVPQVLAARGAEGASAEPCVSIASELIQLSALTKSFGERVLLEHVTWQIGDRDRVGLCGPNGAGKTTLLKMLAGLDEPDAGGILKPNALTIGYLPQDGLTHGGRTVVDEASLALQAAARSEGRDARPRGRGSATPAVREAEHEAMLHRYSELQDRFRLARRLQHRPEGRDRAARPRLRAGRCIDQLDRHICPAAGRCGSRWRSCCSSSPTCCCSTSRPTTSISTRATGSRSTSPPIRTRSSSSRTTATSSTRSSRASPI